MSFNFVNLIVYCLAIFISFGAGLYIGVYHKAMANSIKKLPNWQIELLQITGAAGPYILKQALSFVKKSNEFKFNPDKYVIYSNESEGISIEFMRNDIRLLAFFEFNKEDSGFAFVSKNPDLFGIGKFEELSSKYFGTFNV